MKNLAIGILVVAAAASAARAGCGGEPTGSCCCAKRRTSAEPRVAEEGDRAKVLAPVVAGNSPRGQDREPASCLCGCAAADRGETEAVTTGRTKLDEPAADAQSLSAAYVAPKADPRRVCSVSPGDLPPPDAGILGVTILLL